MLNRRYNNSSERKSVISKIHDMRNGRSFEHYKEKFYIQTGADAIDDEKKRKLFVDHKMLSKAIDLFTSFCPDLEQGMVRGGNKKKADKKTMLVKEALNSISWRSLNSQIYDLMESTGDVFFYVYFDNKESLELNKNIIPKIKLLDSSKMENILTDEANNVTAYIYKETIFDEKISYIDGTVTEENEREQILIFEKGVCHRIINNKAEKGNMVLDEKTGKYSITKKSILNDPSLTDIIPIIHIHSDKHQDEKYSVVPAEEYIDLCLWIDQINSDIRTINRNLGYPKTILLDCIFTEGDGQIGGVRVAQSTVNPDNDYAVRGSIVDMQIKNGLDSQFREYEIAIDNLYDKVGITNPTLMSKVSSSDSSKMYNQVNMRMEQKIEKYIDNIIDGFRVFFEMLFKINGLYDEKYDYGYSFEKPQSIIKNSSYDDLLIKQLELNTGYKTLHEVLKQKGYLDEEIEEHFKNLNEEIRGGASDLSKTKTPKQVTNTVKNANGVEGELQ